MKAVTREYLLNQVYSPLTGTVVASNEAVEDKPGLVNSSPEEDGWLFRVLLQDEQEVKDEPIEEGLMRCFTGGRFNGS